MPEWIGEVAAASPWLGALLAAGFVGFKLWRCLAPSVRRVGEFLDDWSGEDERPGVPARKGVMQRLADIEHELHPNSGKSLRDQTNRLEHALTEHLASCPGKDTA